jgi:hypothetical protein
MWNVGFWIWILEWNGLNKNTLLHVSHFQSIWHVFTPFGVSQTPCVLVLTLSSLSCRLCAAKVQNPRQSAPSLLHVVPPPPRILALKAIVQILPFGSKPLACESSPLNTGFTKPVIIVALASSSFPTAHGWTWLPHPSKNLLWKVLGVA